MTRSFSWSIWPVTNSNSHICIAKFCCCLNSIECNNLIWTNITPCITIRCILNFVIVVSEFLNRISFLDCRPCTSWFPCTNTNYIRWHISIYLLDYIWCIYFCTICRYINRITYSSILIRNPYLNCCFLWLSIIDLNFLLSIFSTCIIGRYANSYLALFKCIDITILIYCCNRFIWTCPYHTFICCIIRFYRCIQLNIFFR